ncbi:MAG TPA: DUF3135 domain-containing protein [Geobacter sp.]|nr:DUF3135 domain-containing protein [Geobacter sp.]
MSSKSIFNLYTPSELGKLYQENPTRFNELADQAIRDACRARTPEKSLKLQQMQWSIEMQLRKAKTPLARMHIMENIFYGKIYGDDGELTKLATACNELLRTATGQTVGPAKNSQDQKKRDLR